MKQEASISTTASPSKVEVNSRRKEGGIVAPLGAALFF